MNDSKKIQQDTIADSVLDVARTVQADLIGNPKVNIRGYTIDSRVIQRGECFFALAGERADGHHYVEAALQAGAGACVVARHYTITDATRKLCEANGAALLVVDDPKTALTRLARHKLGRHGTRVIGVTGSVGKTTTKDMIAAVLAKQAPVLKTQGNYNTEIGMSLSLLQLRPEHRWAVLEYGMRGLGEIAYLCQIAAPEIAVLTVIGESHIGRLRSMERIAEAKGELLEGMKPGGTAVLNASDPWQHKIADRVRGKICWYGSSQVVSPKLQFEMLPDGSVSLRKGEEAARYRLAMLGTHNITNSLAAATVGTLVGLPLHRIAEALNEFRPSQMRGQIEDRNGTIWINDAYNASPTSMRAALHMLVEAGKGRRTIAILGDMLELGEDGPLLHEHIGELFVALGCDILCTIGELGRHIAEGARAAGLSEDRCYSFPKLEQAVPTLRLIIQPGDVVLVKGSRGMQMERIFDIFDGKTFGVSPNG